MSKKLLNFEIEEDIILQLKDIAKENERSISAQVRLIIMQYLKDYNNEKKEV